MKNLFYVSVAFCILSGTSNIASAQGLLHFSNSISGNTTDFLKVTSLTGDADFVSTALPIAHSKTVSAKANAPLITEQCKALHFKFALLLNREVETLTNTKLFEFIDEWWGVKYRYGGTGKKGIDCSAFTSLLMLSVFNLQVPRTARQQFNACEKIEEEDLAEGDLVFFNTRGGVSHVGLYLSDGYFVHSSTSQGVTISNLNDPYYSKRFIEGGRIRN
ncbi:MAG TPA: NlpC/P60 family protein [Ferruginibacter sp.]|nr:NlpC/P60 family protein [Ferruginibacter sp.]